MHFVPLDAQFSSLPLFSRMVRQNGGGKPATASDGTFSLPV
jgi:hypothetical protein